MIEYKIYLPKRREQLLKMIARGKSLKDFAQKYNISVRTAESHKYTLMNELQCTNTIQVMLYAQKYFGLELSDSSDQQ